MERKTDQLERLNFHHLRYFWTVAREGSLRATAERLRVSASSISTQLAQLESALEEKLFLRTGRSLVLTDYGRTVFGYADQIFSLGRDLMQMTASGGQVARRQRLRVGVVDSLPKLGALRLLRPAWRLGGNAVLSCREGLLPELLGLLASQQLDVVLADEPAPATAGAHAFNHLLETSSTSFLAAPALARQLKGPFPKLLHGAPALLPNYRAPLRRELEEWLRDRHLEPRLVCEFDDFALAKSAAAEGLGFIAAPSSVAADAAKRYGLKLLGEAAACPNRWYAITASARLDHPVAQAVAEPGRVRGASLRRGAAGHRPGRRG